MRACGFVSLLLAFLRKSHFYFALGLAAALVLPLSADDGHGGLRETASSVMIRLTKERDGNRIRFFVENLERAGVTATFELGLVNMRGSTGFPCTMSFPAGKRMEAFTLSPVEADEYWTYTLTNHYTLGSNQAVHDDQYLYALPFETGRSFTVSQAFGGHFSHSGAEEYAIDWTMPEGTVVLAARGGVVVALKRDSARGGRDRKFENDANYILVEHNDGTIANYAHLRHDGVSVRVGQRITVGEQIGLSGNTGFSSGPHLHFTVFKPVDGRSRESIPVRFDMGGRAITLVQGQTCQKQNAPLLTTRNSSRGARN